MVTQEQGFSLLELIVVVALIAIMSNYSFQSFETGRSRDKVLQGYATLQAGINQARSAAQQTAAVGNAMDPVVSLHLSGGYLLVCPAAAPVACANADALRVDAWPSNISLTLAGTTFTCLYFNSRGMPAFGAATCRPAAGTLQFQVSDSGAAHVKSYSF